MQGPARPLLLLAGLVLMACADLPEGSGDPNAGEDAAALSGPLWFELSADLSDGEPGATAEAPLPSPRASSTCRPSFSPSPLTWRKPARIPLAPSRTQFHEERLTQSGKIATPWRLASPTRVAGL